MQFILCRVFCQDVLQIADQAVYGVYAAVSSWGSASNSSKHSMMFCHFGVQ